MCCGWTTTTPCNEPDCASQFKKKQKKTDELHSKIKTNYHLQVDIRLSVYPL